MMDRAWMYDLARIDPVYIENVHHFVEEAMRHANKEKKSYIFCPYVDCDNKITWSDSKVVKSHLIKRGFKKSYTIWITHGEIDNALLEVDRGEIRDDNSHYQDGGVFDGADHGNDNDDAFDYEELLCHVEPQVLNSLGTDRGLDNMKILEKSLREPLYDESNSCGKEFTQLHVVLELLKLKASHGWSNNSFSELLSLLAKLLPKPNTLPTSTYRVKKLICLLSLGVDKIHTCPNHYILYHKEHEFKMKCPVCGVSRYKRSYNHVYVDTMKKRVRRILLSVLRVLMTKLILTRRTTRRERFLPW
jgi:hypothetical protein